MTQSDLTKITGITEKVISNIETGASDASIEVFLTLCAALKADPNLILLGEDYKNKFYPFENIPKELKDKTYYYQSGIKKEIYETIHQKLRNKREKGLKLSQETISAKIGIDRRTYSKYEFTLDHDTKKPKPVTDDDELKIYNLFIIFYYINQICGYN